MPMTNREFTLGGWRFIVYEPMNDADPRQLDIVATKGDERRERTVQMFHPNIFGLDVEDNAALNFALEALADEVGIDPNEQPEWVVPDG